MSYISTCGSKFKNNADARAAKGNRGESGIRHNIKRFRVRVCIK